MKTQTNFIKIAFVIIMLSFCNHFAKSQCTGPFVHTTTAVMNQSSMFPNFVNTTVHITADFHINSNFTIAGSDVTIEPGFRIIIDPSSSLTITSANSFSYLHACLNNSVPTMWDGIEITSGTMGSTAGSLTVNGFSVIEDAETAVLVQPGMSYNLTLDNAIFNKNFNHVLLDLGNPVQTVSCTIKNSRFLCRANWAVASSSSNALITPHFNQHTNNSIHALRFNGYIGQVNIFENSNTGIRLYNSNVTVEKNKFFDCRNFGIFAEANSFLRAYDNDFAIIYFNMNRGVRATNFMPLLDVYNNRFTDVTRAIMADNHVYEIFIHRNTITNSSDWAVWANNTYSGYSTVDIHHNSITVPAGNPGNGIRWNETNIAPNPHSFLIHDNSAITGVRLGINVMNVFNPEITNNPQINIVNFQGGYGIRVANCIDVVVRGNTVTGDACNTLLKTAIINENCNDAIVNCNTVNRVTRGFNFRTNTLGNEFFQNTMGSDCFDQFYLGSNPQGLHNIGSNTSSGACLNVWQTNNCHGHNTFGSQSNNSSVFGFTTFFVKSTSTQNPTINGMNPGAPFQPCGTQIVAAGPINGYCGIDALSRHEGLINLAYDSITFTGIDDYKWLADEYQIIALKNNDSLVSTDTVLQNRLAYLEGTNHGLIYKINYWFSVIYDDTLYLDSITTLNTTFNPQNLQEDNFKALNSIRASVVYTGYSSLTPARVLQLRDIAGQCMIEGGTAVYIARIILEEIDDVANDYEDACGWDFRLAGNSLAGDDFSLTGIYPNPASENISIEYALNEHNKAEIEIIDLSGKIIQRLVLSSASNHQIINVADFSEGIYFCKIFLNDKQFSIQKIAVIHQ